MSVLTKEPPTQAVDQAVATTTQVNNSSQEIGSATRLLPAFDFESNALPEPTRPDHADDLIGTESVSLNDVQEARQSPSADVESLPRSWTWAIRKLTTLVAETKGAVTNEVINFVKQYLLGTKLIFVVGKAGTGKTTILAELTGLAELKPGETLKKGTKEYHVCPTIIDDEQYLFIDTAGFGDPDCADLDTFRNTVSCLMALGSFVQVVGILFIIGNPGTRLDQQDAKTLRWVQCFCGPAFFKNVTFVTSFWDSYNVRSFKQAYDRMQNLLVDGVLDQVLHPSGCTIRYHGAHLYHHGVTGGNLTLNSFPGLPLGEGTKERSEELRNLIRQRYAELKFKPVKLQFMMEVENNVPFLETEAAKVLRAPDVGTVVKIVDGKCVIRSATESPIEPPLHFMETPCIEPATWTDTVWKWYDLAVRVARYYREARQKPGLAFSSNVQQAWANIRAWWSGSSEGS